MNAIEFIRPNQFSTEQAVKLLHREVVQKKVPKNLQLKNENVGVVVGVLAINDEIELVIRQLSGLTQYNAHEFYQLFEVAPE